jgi:hypothetical protein
VRYRPTSYFGPLAPALLLPVVALSDNLGRDNWQIATWLFWLCLSLMMAACAIRCLGTTASRRERVLIVFSLALSLYLVKVLHSPTSFSIHDEFGHWRTTHDIATGHHLFKANPLVRAYPFYPGIELVTVAISQMAGVSIFVAGLVVVGLGRVVLAFSLYALFEELTGSARGASIACLVYFSNPNFLFFDSQFAYESLALPFALAALTLAVRRLRGRPAAEAITALIIVSALTVTHHLTTISLGVILSAAGLVSCLGRFFRRRLDLRVLTMAVYCLVAITLWIAFVAPVTKDYVFAPLRSAVSALIALGTNGSGEKQAFGSTGSGGTTPLLEQFVGFGSVIIALGTVPLGLAAFVRRRTFAPVAVVLVLLAISYPATLALRLTQAGTETSNRSSEWVFLGIGYLAARTLEPGALPLASYFGWIQRRRNWARGRMVAFTGLFVVLFTGGVTVGWPAYALLPGPYLVGGDTRSIETQSIDAARWAPVHLQTESSIVTDRENGLLFGSYGLMRPQGGVIGGSYVTDVFFSPRVSPRIRAILSGDKIRYVVIDTRLSTALPYSGAYMESPEPGAHHHKAPIALENLEKFDTTKGALRLFDSGAIQIYDVSRIAGLPNSGRQ